MTEIEKKALELVNEVLDEWEVSPTTEDEMDGSACFTALCRLIEQHKIFRQEVSDAIAFAVKVYGGHRTALDPLCRFIIAKPDPLVEAWKTQYPDDPLPEASCDNFRAALAKRGGRIVFDD